MTSAGGEESRSPNPWAVAVASQPLIYKRRHLLSDSSTEAKLLLLRTAVDSDRGQVIRTRGRLTLAVVHARHRPRYMRLHAGGVVICPAPVSMNNEGDHNDAEEADNTRSYYDNHHRQRYA